MTQTIQDKLADIQRRLHAPKNKRNDFGKYNYRNAEGIIAAFKALDIPNASIVCRDTLQEVAGQIFVTATAELSIDGETISATGHAMHPLQKKGMDASQITGTASSYARKYALGGLLAIEDESQDPDSQDNRKENGQTPAPVHTVTPDQYIKLRDAAEQARVDEAKICQSYGASSLQQFPASRFDSAMKKLQITIDNMPAQNNDLGGDEIPY